MPPLKDCIKNVKPMAKQFVEETVKTLQVTFAICGLGVSVFFSMWTSK